MSPSSFGVVRSCRCPTRTSWHVRTAARQWRGWQLSGTVDAAGWFTAGANIRSSRWVTRVVALVSNGRLRSPESVAAGGGVAIAPLGSSSKRRSLFGQSSRAMTCSDIRVTRSVRGERPQGCTWHGSGVVTVGVTTRRSAGHSCVVARSGVFVHENQFERTAQHANGADAPGRLVRSCHRARAAHLLR